MEADTAKEYWKQRFGEYPKTDSEKLAVAMMQEYSLHKLSKANERIKELEDELQSLKENPICVHCEKYRTSQGDGLIHQFCECNLNALNPKTEKCKCEFPLIRNDGKEYCGNCNENI